MKINRHYLDLEKSYLFTDINHKVAAYQASHPGQSIIRLGIGDVTLPLCPAVVSALEKAVLKWGSRRPSAATARNRGMTSCGRRLPGIMGNKGVAFNWTRSL